MFEAPNRCLFLRNMLSRQQTHKIHPAGGKSAKYQGFGARRQGWLPCQAPRDAEMKRICRPSDLPDFPFECVAIA